MSKLLDEPNIDAFKYFVDTFKEPYSIINISSRSNSKSRISWAYFDEMVNGIWKRNFNIPKIEKVVSNEKNGYTIVKFENGHVSKVKCNNEEFDLEKAVSIAICKYIIGNNEFYKAINNATVIKKEEK